MWKGSLIQAHHAVVTGIFAMALGVVVGCGGGEEPVAPASPRPASPVVEAPRPVVERIAPEEITDEKLEQWYPRLVMAPAEIPRACRPDEEDWSPTPQLHREYERRLAGLILELVDEDALPGVEQMVAEGRQSAMEFLLMESLGELVEVDEEEVSAFFEENRARFARPETASYDFYFHEGEVMAGPTVDAPPAPLVTLAEMAAEGVDRQELHRTAALHGVVYSERRMRAVRDSLPPLLEAAIFETPEGEFSPVRRTENGWHLIQLHGIQSAEEPDFETLRSRLGEQLRHQKLDELRRELRNHLAATDNASEGDFTESLYSNTNSNGLDRLMEMIYNNALTHGYQSYLLSGENLFTEEEKRAYFGEHRDTFMRRTHYHVLEAQVPLHAEDADVSDQWKEQAARVERRREVMVWVERLKAEGRGFLDLEQGEAGFPVRVLDRGSEPQGPRGAMLDLAVQDLEVGEFSMPKPSRQFFHVYQLVGTEPPAPMDFEEAKRDVEQRMRIRRVEENYTALACRALEAALDE